MIFETNSFDINFAIMFVVGHLRWAISSSNPMIDGQSRRLFHGNLVHVPGNIVYFV